MPYFFFFSYPSAVWDDTFMGGFLKELADSLFPRIDPPLPIGEDVYFRHPIDTSRRKVGGYGPRSPHDLQGVRLHL